MRSAFHLAFCLVVLLVAVLAMAFAVGEQAYADESSAKHFYIGAGLNEVRVSFDDSEYENYVRDKFRGVNLYFGKRLSSRTAIELGYLRLANSKQSVTTPNRQTPFRLFDTEGVAAPQTTATTKATVQGFHADALRFFPLHSDRQSDTSHSRQPAKAEAIATIGVLRLNSKVSVETNKPLTTQGGAISRFGAEKSFLTPRLGGGLQWRLGGKARLRGLLHYYPVDRFQDIIGSAWSGSLSLNFSF